MACEYNDRRLVGSEGMTKEEGALEGLFVDSKKDGGYLMFWKAYAKGEGSLDYLRVLNKRKMAERVKYYNCNTCWWCVEAARGCQRP